MSRSSSRLGLAGAAVVAAGVVVLAMATPAQASGGTGGKPPKAAGVSAAR